MKDSRINPDGSETVGILEDVKEPAEEKPKKPKKTKKN